MFQNVNSPNRTPGSTPSSASHPVSTATESKTNSVERSDAKPVKKDSFDRSDAKSAKKDSFDKGVRNMDKTGTGSKSNSLDKREDNAMSKSSEFSDFDSIMSQSVTSIGSDIVTPMKRNGKYAKNKESPLRERRESPARALKGKDKEVLEKDSRTESPSRYKKNSKESPVDKRRNRRQETEQRGTNRLSSDISERKEESNSSANRLSRVGGMANNNIFYLIDPTVTVKNKCKSVGDVAAANRKSADFSKDAQNGKNLL